MSYNPGADDRIAAGVAALTDADVVPDEPRSSAERVFHACAILIPPLGVFSIVPMIQGSSPTSAGLFAFFAMYVLTGTGLTVGFHRLFAHQSFRTSRPFAYFLAVCGSMSAQEPFFMWVASHRRHHQFSDRVGDPHSPHRYGNRRGHFVKGLAHAHMGWLFAPKAVDIYRYIPDLRRDAGLVLIDRLSLVLILFGLLLPAAAGGAISRDWRGACVGFAWGGLVRMFVVHHITWSINSICHTWGRRPFRSQDRSTNNLICALLSFGEGWHNNHHAFPASARHGLKWWEIDMTWWVIQALEKLGLVWDVRLPSPEAIAAKGT